MYSNYNNYPMNYQYNYPINTNQNYPYTTNNDDRFIAGGFLAPFLLGGLAGYALTPGRFGRPYYYNNYYYGYPPYRPYYYRPYPKYYY